MLQNLDYIGSEGNFSIADEVAIDISGNELKNNVHLFYG